jgi:hypothetical protein
MLYIFNRCATNPNFGREMKSYVIYLSQMCHKSKFWKRNEKLCHISFADVPQIQILEEKWKAMSYIFRRCATNPNFRREMKSNVIYLSQMLHKSKFEKRNEKLCHISFADALQIQILEEKWKAMLYLLQMLYKSKF